MNNTIYRISETGTCSRALVAMILGNDPVSQTTNDEERLKYYTLLEEVCAQKISDLHIGELQPGIQSKVCDICNDGERKGVHVEIKTDLVDFVGHLDRRIKINGVWYPVEIKSVGKFKWPGWIKNNFKTYPSYEYQECCYLHAEQKPGLYFCMNRDTGELAKYIINDRDKELSLDGFTNLELSITFEQILEKLVNIEIEISNGTMPKGEEHADCIWCHYRYLCIKDIVEKKTAIVKVPALLEAATMYEEGLRMEKLGSNMKDTSKFALLEHAKHELLDKYRVLNVSVSYRGQKTKKWYDNAVLEELVDKKVLKKALRESAPYDDCTLRVIKEKEDQ